MPVVPARISSSSIHNYSHNCIIINQEQQQQQQQKKEQLVVYHVGYIEDEVILLSCFGFLFWPVHTLPSDVRLNFWSIELDPFVSFRLKWLRDLMRQCWDAGYWGNICTTVDISNGLEIRV